jgi:hypothetical protein
MVVIRLRTILMLLGFIGVVAGVVLAVIFPDDPLGVFVGVGGIMCVVIGYALIIESGEN